MLELWPSGHSEKAAMPVHLVEVKIKMNKKKCVTAHITQKSPLRKIGDFFYRSNVVTETLKL